MDLSDQVLSLIVNTFQQSPRIGFGLVLCVWLGCIWWFKLFKLGRKHRFDDNLLLSFSIEPTQRITLLKLSRVIADECANQAPKYATETDERWKVGEIFFALWTIKAMGIVTKILTVILIFVCFSIVVMFIAQPSSSVSLYNVINSFGSAAIAGILLLVLLSFGKLLCSIHKLPVSTIKNHSDWAVILLAW